MSNALVPAAAVMARITSATTSSMSVMPERRRRDVAGSRVGVRFERVIGASPSPAGDRGTS